MCEGPHLPHDVNKKLHGPEMMSTVGASSDGQVLLSHAAGAALCSDPFLSEQQDVSQQIFRGVKTDRLVFTPLGHQ